jgi:hypothetical protein
MAASSATNALDQCYLCQKPFIITNSGDMMKQNDLDVITLHSQQHNQHKVHRICALNFFTQQIENESHYIKPDDFEISPFSCPICNLSLTLEDVEKSTGYQFEGYLKKMRALRLDILLTQRWKEYDFDFGYFGYF